MPDEKNPLTPILEKLDAMEQRLESLEHPPEEESIEEKTDARDLSLEKGKSFFKSYLKDALPKEKLDAYTFEELLVAAELKSTFSNSTVNPAPPLTKTDHKEDPRPSWMRPVVN